MTTALQHLATIGAALPPVAVPDLGMEPTWPAPGQQGEIQQQPILYPEEVAERMERCKVCENWRVSSGGCHLIPCNGRYIQALRSGVMPKGCPQAGAVTFEPDCPEEKENDRP